MSKKSTMSTLLSLIVLLFFLPSCGASKQYTAYLETMKELNQNRAQPGVSQTFDPTGRLLSQTITLPQQPIMPQQEQPSEWASVFKTAFAVGLPVVGMVWNTYAAGEAFSNVAEAVQGNTTGSNNSTITETTETVTTETITNPGTASW